MDFSRNRLTLRSVSMHTVGTFIEDNEILETARTDSMLTEVSTEK